MKKLILLAALLLGSPAHASVGTCAEQASIVGTVQGIRIDYAVSMEDMVVAVVSKKKGAERQKWSEAVAFVYGTVPVHKSDRKTALDYLKLYCY